MVPDAVLRAIAASPPSAIRDTLLGSLGLSPALEPVSESVRLEFASKLAEHYEPLKQAEVPF